MSWKPWNLWRSAEAIAQSLLDAIRRALSQSRWAAAKAAGLAEMIEAEGQRFRELGRDDFMRWLGPIITVVELAGVAESEALARGYLKGSGKIKLKGVRERAELAITVADAAFDAAWDEVLQPALERFIERANRYGRWA
jgi:hypothetical protein